MNYLRLISTALKEGFSDIEIYESFSNNQMMNIFNSQIDKNEQSKLTTITIRAIYQGKMAYLSLENTEEKIPYIINNLKNNASILTTDEKFFIYEGSKTYPQVVEAENDFASFTGVDKLNLLLELEKTLKNIDPRIVMIPYCEYQESATQVKIINSKGLNVEKKNHYAAIFVQAVAKENSDTQSSFEIQIEHKISSLDPQKISQNVAKKVLAMLNAKSLASKEYPVVIENKAMTSLLSAYQSIFSGEAAIKKITPLLGKENELIANKNITIIDAPLKEDAIMVHPFDDEGVACYDKEVIKEGVFQGFLHNLKTAHYFKTSSTGNGFKQGAGLGVSATNFYIAPGTKSKEEMIASISEGLLITGLDGLHAGINTISGDFSLKAYGFYILDGLITRPVSLIVMAGNFFNLLKEVSEVGNDLDLSYTGIGAPSIKIPKIAISGE